MPVTYKLHPDIKSSSIPTFVSSLLYHNNILVSYLSHSHYFYILVSFIIATRVFNMYPDSSGGSVRGVLSTAINKSEWWEPQWVVSKTASWTQHKPDSRGRQHQLQPSTTTRWAGVTAEYFPKQVAWAMKPSGRRYSAGLPLDGPTDG